MVAIHPGDETQTFTVPFGDATVPDLLGSKRPKIPTLTIVKGSMLGQTFELRNAENTIGRDPKNNIFLNDRTVSRRHACITISSDPDKGAIITDLSSLNGTWVNGSVTNRSPLTDGSTVQIGTFRMVYHG